MANQVMRITLKAYALQRLEMPAGVYIDIKMKNN